MALGNKDEAKVSNTFSEIVFKLCKICDMAFLIAFYGPF